MKIPTKFKVNTDDFKVYFDNSKKTHVCENVETGEKTNIGVLGILMQMGILKQIEESRGMEERIKFLSERIDSLENKIDEAMKSMTGITVKEKREVKENFEEPKEEVEEEPKSEIKKRIMKKVLEQTEEPAKEEDEETEEDEEEQEENDAVVESNEEIDNWMKI
jgi:hypothetical protein